MYLATGVATRVRKTSKIAKMIFGIVENIGEGENQAPIAPASLLHFIKIGNFNLDKIKLKSLADTEL